MRRWKTTDLSVRINDDAQDARAYRVQISAADTRVIYVPLGDDVESAVVTLQRLDSGDALTGAAAPDIEFADGVAAVTVSGFHARVDYELRVTGIRDDDTTVTKTVAIECVS